MKNLFPIVLLGITAIGIVTLVLHIRNSSAFAQGVTCNPIGYYCVNNVEFAAYDDVNCAFREDTPTGNSCTVDPNNLCGPQREGSCSRGSICDCTINCLLPNILPAGQGCCSDKGNVCQTGLTCTSNKCAAPTSTPTPPGNNQGTGSGGLRQGQITAVVDPNKKEFYEPDFVSMGIQAGFLVLTLAIIFSLVK